MDIGKKLKEKRVEANYTQKDLAEILHVSRQTISSWEVGRTYPDLDVLIAISELYETPLDDLLKSDSDMVMDITNKVKQSERRKLLNILLGTVLVVILILGLYSLWEGYQNNQANEEGLRPSDIYESTWESKEAMDKNVRSVLSFSKDSIVAFDTVEPENLPPTLSLEDLTRARENAAKNKSWAGSDQAGATSLLVSYDNLQVEVIGDIYYITAQGYDHEFKRISEDVIQARDGSTFRRIASESSHESLHSLAEHLE